MIGQTVMIRITVKGHLQRMTLVTIGHSIRRTGKIGIAKNFSMNGCR